MAEHSSYQARLTVLLEDVTEDTAREFWDRLNYHEISLRLDDGLLYVASVEMVTPS